MSDLDLDPTRLEGRAALLAIALDAAREAGTLVLPAWRRGVRPEHKGPIDLVTEHDRASEALLRERLHERTPFPVVGEELGADAAATGDAKARWYVDPIDGTTNFVHGHPFWCVSVGLLVGGEAALGVIVAPALRTEWTGYVGGGATRDGAPCHVSAVDRFPDALLATGFPYDRRTSPRNNFAAFVAIKKQAQAVRRCGSAALDCALVADGTYDGYWEMKLGAWDVAAGAALVVAAGGKITDFAGGPADVTRGELVATNGRIHDALVDALGRVAQ
jgi:myo-inositol-1(or 4)-monophosphatase